MLLRGDTDQSATRPFVVSQFTLSGAEGNHETACTAAGGSFDKLRTNGSTI
ncbi:MAG: hypothetical protein V1724_00775 [Chloroflexota bacterium]